MIIYKEISKKQILETVIVFALGTLVLGMFYQVKSLLFASGGILLASLILPTIFKPLVYLWFGLSKVLGWVSTRIILSVLFYCLVTPVGYLRRLLRKDTLQLKAFKKMNNSAFKQRKHLYSKSDLQYPF